MWLKEVEIIVLIAGSNIFLAKHWSNTKKE
jgi:hypothetical protein